MGYWNYYLIWIALSYLVAQPKLLVGLLVLLLLRRVLPAPGPILHALRRGRQLREQVELNPKNATAARDLAMLELELLRPRAALASIEKALERTPDDAELLYLAGIAKHRLGRHEEALPAFVASVESDPSIRFGLAYLFAGDALDALQRWEPALDAYERYHRINSSDIRGLLGIARANHQLGHRDAAAQALTETFRTFRLLPHHLRAQSRRTLWSAYWAKIWMLRDPRAITVAAIALVLTGLLAIALARAAPSLLELFSEPAVFVDSSGSARRTPLHVHFDVAGTSR